jgi:hypothetical protein
MALDMSRQMSLNRHEIPRGTKIRLMIRILLVSSFRLAFLAGPWIAPAAAADLTPGEIRDELIGRSITWWEDGGWLGGWLVLMPDGTAEITVDRPGAVGDSGRWAIRGGEICTRWGEIRAGAEKCYSIRRGADGRFVTSGGNVFEVRETGV